MRKKNWVGFKIIEKIMELNYRDRNLGGEVERRGRVM